MFPLACSDNNYLKILDKQCKQEFKVQNAFSRKFEKSAD